MGKRDEVGRPHVCQDALRDLQGADRVHVQARRPDRSGGVGLLRRLALPRRHRSRPGNRLEPHPRRRADGRPGQLDPEPRRCGEVRSVPGGSQAKVPRRLLRRCDGELQRRESDSAAAAALSRHCPGRTRCLRGAIFGRLRDQEGQHHHRRDCWHGLPNAGAAEACPDACACHGHLDGKPEPGLHGRSWPWDDLVWTPKFYSPPRALLAP